MYINVSVPDSLSLIFHKDKRYIPFIVKFSALGRFFLPQL